MEKRHNISRILNHTIVGLHVTNQDLNISRNNSMNFTSDNDTMPDFSMSEGALTGLTVLYTLTTIFSITGNVFVVLVFARGRRSRTDLRPFLINLAAADLIMAMFCMPFTFADVILGKWIFYKPLCPIVLFVQIFSVAGSVFTNMAIGIDRFLAVTFPLRSRVTYARAKYVIVTIWVCAFILASVMFFVGRATDVGDGAIKCVELWENDARRIFTISILILTYLVPLLILTVTYSIVGILLWKRTAPGNKDHVRDMHRLRSKIKVMKMLVIVVAVFGICWLPIHVFNLVADYYPEIMGQSENAVLILVIFLSVHWLAMSNSFANPIIYGFTNESFRADLVTLFYMWLPCCGCLKNAMPRLSSMSTKDSVILRRASTKRSNWNNSTMRSSSSSSRRFLKSQQNTQEPKRYLEPVPGSRECSNYSSAANT